MPFDGACRKKKHSKLPSRKLTAKASENWWLEDIGRWSFPFGFRTIFRGELFVFGRVITTSMCNKLSLIKKCCNFSQRSPNGCSTPFKESSTQNNHGPTTRETPVEEQIWFLPKMVKIRVEHLFYKQKIHVLKKENIQSLGGICNPFFHILLVKLDDVPRDRGEHWKNKKHLQLETSQCFTKVSPNRWNLDHHRKPPRTLRTETCGSGLIEAHGH